MATSSFVWILIPASKDNNNNNNPTRSDFYHSCNKKKEKSARSSTRIEKRSKPKEATDLNRSLQRNRSRSCDQGGTCPPREAPSDGDQKQERPQRSRLKPCPKKKRVQQEQRSPTLNITKTSSTHRNERRR